MTLGLRSKIETNKSNKRQKFLQKVVIILKTDEIIINIILYKKY